MQRWCEAHPDADVYPFDLKAIYVHDKLNPRAAANGKVYPPRFDDSPLREGGMAQEGC
jgi:hypothetical protein